MTHTHTHTHVPFANPYLRCTECDEQATGFHHPDKCGCESSNWLIPCKHEAGTVSICTTWGPLDGCHCREVFGRVPHSQETPR